MASNSFDGPGVVIIGSGGSAGQRIIPELTPLRRLHFFDGKFLRAPDLTLEQNALLTQVRMSNQAGGSGIVHGFTCSVNGATLSLDAGLAIDPNGRLLHLPEAAQLPVATLIGESQARASRETQAEVGFEACAGPADSGVTGDPGDGFYLLVALHAEAFCGSEDVYGKLCEAACVTDSERPYISEGIVLQALPISLDLPSSGVTLGPIHERSRAASAYFRERRGVWPSLISRSGLESEIWCLGAELAAGQGVPLALLSYRGGIPRFLDNWIARRERMDSAPRHYWAGRMAMRPWPVFMAEVLQFQCQLPGALVPSDGPGPADPACGVQWELVRKAALKIQEISLHLGGKAQHHPQEKGLVTPAIVDELQDLVPDLLAMANPPGSARTLIDGGIMELPSAGWLPVKPSDSRSVNQQVRTLLGKGLDLRFCVVRPDYVPHALEEAQHMERISLLQGLDDPECRPEVDILVPGGRIEAINQPVPGSGYVMTMDLDPQFDQKNQLKEEQDPKLATAAGIARTVTVSTIDRMRTLFAGAIPGVVAEAITAGGDIASPKKGVGGIGPVQGVRPQVDLVGAAREQTAADGDYQFHYAAQSPAQVVRVGKNPIRELPQAQQLSIWIEFHLAGDPYRIADGASLRLDARVVFLSVEADPEDPVDGTDIKLFGYLRRTRHTQGEGLDSVGGRFEVDGHSDRIDGDEPPNAISIAGNFSIERGRDRDGLEQLAITIEILQDHGTGLTGTTFLLKRHWESAGTSRYRLEMSREADKEAASQPMISAMKARREVLQRVIIAGTLGRVPEVSQPSHPMHAASISALKRIGAVLRDNEFAGDAALGLFPPPEPAVDELRVLAREDWVLFHRRRTRVCEPQAPAAEPLPARFYRVYRITAGVEDALERIVAALNQGQGTVSPAFEPQLITLAEYTPGIQTLRGDHTAIIASWQQGLATNETIHYGAIVSQGEALDEGGPLALARLTSLANLLSPLPATVEFETLGTFPDTLEGGGVDGVIVLVTLVAEVELETHCHDSFVVDADPARAKIIIAALGEKEVAQVVATAGGRPLLSDIEFDAESPEFANPPVQTAQIARAWESYEDFQLSLGKSRSKIVQIAVVAPAGGPDSNSRYVSQGNRIAMATGETSAELQTSLIPAPQERSPCAAATVLFAQPKLPDTQIHAVFARVDLVRNDDIQQVEEQLAKVLGGGGWVKTFASQWTELGRPEFEDEAPLPGGLGPVAQKAESLGLFEAMSATSFRAMLAYSIVPTGTAADDAATALAQAKVIAEQLKIERVSQVTVNVAALPEGLPALTLVVLPTLKRELPGLKIPIHILLGNLFDDGDSATVPPDVVIGVGNNLSFAADGAVLKDTAFDQTVAALKNSGTQIKSLEVVLEKPGQARTDPRTTSLLAALKEAGVASADAKAVRRKARPEELKRLRESGRAVGGALVFRR